jgi:fimbrial chaperone protein
MGKLTRVLSLLLGAVLALGSRANASSFTVNPVKITLSGKEQSALLGLQNQTDEEIRFKIVAHAWQQSPDGAMKLQDTKDVVVFPTLLTLGPRQMRKLRVGMTVAPGDVEKTYRVFVEELPPLKSPTADKSEVRVLTKMGIPIFIAPGKSTVVGVVEGKVVSKATLDFTVKNTGSVHFLASALWVRGLDSAGATVFEKKIEGWYVLAGGSRSWKVEIPASACAKTKVVSVDVQAIETTFNGRIPMPVAGCGP